MIKLKDLIVENESFVWNSPQGTPDKVTKVYNLIVGYLLKRKMDPNNFLTQIIEQNEEGEDEIIRDYYIIRNVANPPKSLVYYASIDEEGWKMGNGPNNNSYLSGRELINTIKTWGER